MLPFAPKIPGSGGYRPETRIQHADKEALLLDAHISSFSYLWEDRKRPLCPNGAMSAGHRPAYHHQVRIVAVVGTEFVGTEWVDATGCSLPRRYQSGCELDHGLKTLLSICTIRSYPRLLRLTM